MIIQPQTQNFGAIKITPKQPPKLVQALEAKKITQEDFDMEQDWKFVDNKFMKFIQDIGTKFDSLPELGKDMGRNCFNIFSKQGSEQEKTMLKELSEGFDSQKLDFQAESIPDEAAMKSLEDFEYASKHALENYRKKNAKNV